MSLERKDLRLYLDPEIHDGLGILADADRADLKELAERVLRRYVIERIHAANVIAQRAEKAGISRINPEFGGKGLS